MASLQSAYLWRTTSYIRSRLYSSFSTLYHRHSCLASCSIQSSPSFSTLSRNVAASDDRHLLIQKSKDKLHKLLNSPTCYQSITDKEDRSDIPQKLIHCESIDRYLGRYRGAVILKTLYDLVVYYHLFSQLKPKTIIELGTFTGAFALWYADAISSLGLDTQIYMVDIDPTLVSEETKQKLPDNVKLIKGDINKIADLFPPAMLQSLPHPWLVIEDGHNFFETVITYFNNNYMTTGDHLVVLSETNSTVPEYS